MTASLISLISILLGIIGANLTGFVLKKYSFDLVGNTIAGVFGSIFFIKTFSRFGFDPISILQSGNINFTLFFINCLVSFLGGGLAIFLLKMVKNEMNNQNSNKKNMISSFKVISFLEGLSYILLLFIGVPLKYVGNNDLLVKFLGMPHGMLFLAYVIITLLIRGRMNWDVKSTFAVLIASLLPFGTFYINKKYFGTAF